MSNNAIRANLSNGLLRDLYAFDFVESQSPPFQSIFRQLFDVVENQPGRNVKESTGIFNSNLKVTGDGQDIEFTDPNSGRVIVGKKERYTDGMSISRDIVERDGAKDALKNILEKWVSAKRRSMELKMEKHFADLAFNHAGFSSGDAIYNGTTVEMNDPSGNYMYDGVCLLNLSTNTRTLKVTPQDGATNSFYNSLGASGADLTNTNFNSAWVLMTGTNAYNDAGERDIIVPTHLVVPPAGYNAAQQIIKTSSGSPGDVNNGYNTFMNIAGVLVNPFIENATAWYLYSKIPNAWTAYIDAPIFGAWFDEKTASYNVSVDFRFGHLLTRWNNIVGGNCPTS